MFSVDKKYCPVLRQGFFSQHEPILALKNFFAMLESSLHADFLLKVHNTKYYVSKAIYFRNIYLITISLNLEILRQVQSTSMLAHSIIRSQEQIFYYLHKA